MDKTDFDEICFHTVCPAWECIIDSRYSQPSWTGLAMKSFKIIGGEEFNCCAIYRWDKTVAIMSDLLRGEA